MHKINNIYHIRDNISISGFAGIRNKEEFKESGFDAHLQCANDFDSWIKDYADVKCIPFDDYLPIPNKIMDESHKWLSEHWDNGSNILISCAAGESRSVSMAAGILYNKTDLTFMDSCVEIFAKIPTAYPHPNTLVSVADYFNVATDVKYLKEIYSRIRVQPPFPWKEDTLLESLR